jgi:hypothetical protein
MKACTANPFLIEKRWNNDLRAICIPSQIREALPRLTVPTNVYKVPVNITSREKRALLSFNLNCQ